MCTCSNQGAGAGAGDGHGEGDGPEGTSYPSGLVDDVGIPWGSAMGGPGQSSTISGMNELVVRKFAGRYARIP